MARIACVEVYQYLLQILGARGKEWQSHPCVVVTEDLPGGTVLEVNGPAREAGVREGMRFAAALSLVHRLRAAAVAPAEKERSDQILLRALYKVSPQVEISRRDPGVFWVGARGMERIFGTPLNWSRACRTAVEEAGFRSRIALGWTRAGTYAGARGRSDRTSFHRTSFQEEEGIRIFSSPREESDALERAPLSVLALSSRARNHLLTLGVDTAGAFRALPPESVRRRFDDDTGKVHDALRAAVELPIAAPVFDREYRYDAACSHPVREMSGLTPVLEILLEQAEKDLRRDARSVVVIRLELLMEEGEPRLREIRPARPTSDMRFLSKLLLLKLTEVDASVPEGASGGPSSGKRRKLLWNSVVRCIMNIDTAPLSISQGLLFAPGSTAGGDGGATFTGGAATPSGGASAGGGATTPPGRASATAAGNKIPPHGSARNSMEIRDKVSVAISLMRARFGNDAVGHFVKQEAYLPDHSVRWEILGRPAAGTTAAGTTAAESAGMPTPLVRRMLHVHRPVQVCERSGTVITVGTVKVERSFGPYLLSGHWWADEYNREYYYLELRDGPLLWVYRDARSGAWALQGTVE